MNRGGVKLAFKEGTKGLFLKTLRPMKTCAYETQMPANMFALLGVNLKLHYTATVDTCASDTFQWGIRSVGPSSVSCG